MRRRKRSDSDFNEEIQAHIELETARLVSENMDAESAQAMARRRFGNVTVAREQFHEYRRTLWLDHLFHDVRYALRTLGRTPGFTAVAIVTLCLGIGANTAIFSVVNTVLLKPLPYKDPDRIVRIIQNRPPGSGLQGVAPRTAAIRTTDLNSWRMQTETLSHMAAYSPITYTYTEGGEPGRIVGARVSPAMLQLLGTDVFMGRGFNADEEMPAKGGVIVLSYAAWQKYFSGDPNVLNRSITLGDRGYVVVGVMPESFEFPDKQTEVWTPLDWHSYNIPTIARLAPGISMEAATAEANVLFPAFREENSNSRIELVSVKDELVAPVRPAILVLLTAVGLVLLIACANVANLLLVRAASRQKEIAIRASLGASRLRLIRQVITESVMLALFGGVVATGLAFAGIQLLSSIGTANIPRLEDVRIDATVFAFTLVVSILTGILFGAAPALRVARADPMQTIKEGGAARASGADLFGRNRTRSILTVAEIALALILLVSSGLLITSFLTLTNIDPGYDPKNLLTFEISLPSSRYTPPQRFFFWEQMHDRIRQLPGVRAAATTNALPLRGGGVTNGNISFEGRPQPTTPEEAVSADLHVVSRDYLSTMGIRVVEGRGFAEGDGAGRPPVMLINQTMARLHFPDGPAVGERVRFVTGRVLVEVFGVTGADREPIEIVGVIDDVRYTGLDAEPVPAMYVNVAQRSILLPPPRPGGPVVGLVFPMEFAVRTADDPLETAAVIRSMIRQVDPLAMIDGMATMEQRLFDSVSQPRFYTVLIGIFAGIAVTLAAVGIYGLMAYSVTQRTREIGIRIALGAERREVLSLVLRQGLMLAVIGIVLGILGALALTRYLEGMLFGLTPSDPLTFVVVALVIASVAAFASYIPALRATKVDPVIALRYE